MAAVATISAVFVAVSPAQAAGNCNQTARVYRQTNYTAAIPASAQTTDGLTCNLQQGMNNEAVRQLQYTLNLCYGAGLTADGDFGALTKAALQSAQAIEGTTADGQYGPNTRNALKWFEYEGETPSCRRIRQPPTLYAEEPPPTTAPPGMPNFQLPFLCGQTWRLRTYNGHGDFDIDMDRTDGTHGGRPVVAAEAGTVIKARFETGAGNMVRIDHGAWHTSYLHLQDLPLVAEGTWVPKGKLLGYVGHTGSNSSEYDHLHYEQQVENPDGTRTTVQAYFNGVPSGITDDAAYYPTWPQFTSSNVCTAL